jgi:hypothetical protein
MRYNVHLYWVNAGKSGNIHKRGESSTSQALNSCVRTEAEPGDVEYDENKTKRQGPQLIRRARYPHHHHAFAPLTLLPASRPTSPSTSSAGPSSAMLPGAGDCPSQTPWMRLIVLSMLRLLVLGLVIVVPKLACRPWPRRNAVVGLVGELGLVLPETGEPKVPPRVVGEVLVLRESGGAPPFCCARAASRLAAVIAADMSRSCSAGVDGMEDDEMMALPSSDEASNSSGGSRSFSISDLRLR